MEKRRSNNPQAIQKRNIKKLRCYYNVFPQNRNRPVIPVGFLESQVSTVDAQTEELKNHGSHILNVSNINLPSTSGKKNVEMESYCEENTDDVNDISDDNDDDNDNNVNSNSSDSELVVNEKNTSKHIVQNSNTEQNDVPMFLTDNIGLQMSLHSKKNITVKDHLLSTIAISVRHKLSYEGTLDIFRWMKMSHDSSIIPTTKGALWMLLSHSDNNIIKHYYCKQCNGYLGTKCKETNELQINCACSACGPNKQATYLGSFLKLNVTAQIKQLFQNQQIIKFLNYKVKRIKRNFEACEDIYDGYEYRKLCTKGKFLENEYNFSLTFNTDGCQVTNSTKTAAWPIYLQINELPPHLRKKYMLLAGIYVEKTHPLMNNYLRPLIDEIKVLHEVGIKWKSTETTEITSKFIINITSVDLPARESITRMTQFNGESSCIFCYAKGESCSRGRYVFPFDANFDHPRTHSQVKADMKQALREKSIVRGMKGISSLISLPCFNICTGIVVEGMHSVFLGVVKQHTKILLTSTHSKYYIGKPTDKALTDQCLLSIRPPSQRSRTPKSIATWKQWKASEWRNWLGYAPVCLEGILEDKYIQHLAGLAEAIHYLNSSSITRNEIDRAENLLHRYVENFQEYFGIQNMTHNVHLMTHITESVRNWGPIWSHSAFVFESWNKKIIEKITSPYCRAEQIATRFLMHRFIENSIYDSSTSEELKTFVKRMLNIVDTNDLLANNIILSSYINTRPPTNIEKIMLLEKGYNPENLLLYQKIIVNSIEFQCTNANSTEHHNSTIFDGENNFGQIDCIAQFSRENKTNYVCFIKLFEIISYSFNTRYIQKCKLSNNVKCIIDIDKIEPAVEINKAGYKYVFKLSNCWETD